MLSQSGEVAIQMTLDFEYARLDENEEHVGARGQQVVVCS